jgi:hypothetical protein
LMFFFSGPFGWPITKNIMKFPLSRNHILLLFYIYIVLHGMKRIYIILHLHILFVHLHLHGCR